jgi:hypothetical protein
MCCHALCHVFSHYCPMHTAMSMVEGVGGQTSSQHLWEEHCDEHIEQVVNGGGGDNQRICRARGGFLCVCTFVSRACTFACAYRVHSTYKHLPPQLHTLVGGAAAEIWEGLAEVRQWSNESAILWSTVCIRLCVRACVRMCVRACVRTTCVHTCMLRTYLQTLSTTAAHLGGGGGGGDGGGAGGGAPVEQRECHSN